MDDKPADEGVKGEQTAQMSTGQKILLGVGTAIVVGVLAFLALVMMQPDEFHVSRSATIDAPPAQVFPHVNNLHKWQEWSPWAELDPNAKNTFKGPDEGEGAEFHWDGNDDVGAGSMKIVESKPAELVRYNLNFIRPYEDSCEVRFQLQPAGEGTEVTWVMQGENNFMAKVMCLFMDIDAMVGKDFEKGLARLKKAAEEDGANEAPSAETEKQGNGESS